MTEIRKSLYLKYRPQNFDSLIGQDHIRKILKAATLENKISQAYLLIGPRGTGKTTTARLIAKVLNCTDLKDGKPCEACASCIAIQEGNFMDVIEIDAASNTGVDDMRDLIEKAHFSPSIGKKKVFIIDEVHMLSKSAFNALLKTLEEPPSHVHFILATTEANKVPATIISRCQRFDFRRIVDKDIVDRLIFICNQEKIEFDKNALFLIAKSADGGMRDAISLLEKVVIKNELKLENVENSLGIVKIKVIGEFINLILEKKTSLALNYIDKLYQDGVNLIQFKKESLEYLRQKILETIKEDKDKVKINRLLKIIEEFNTTNVENAIIPQFPFELTICRLTLSEAKRIVLEEKVDVKDKVTERQGEIVPDREEIASSSNMTRNDSTEKDGQENVGTEHVVQEQKPSIPDTEEYKFTSAELPEQKFTVRPTLDSVRDDWKKITDKVKDPSLKFSLREVFLEKLENDILEISINSEFQFNKINNNESKSKIEEVLKDSFNLPIKIKITLSQVKIEKTEVIKQEVEDIRPQEPVTKDIEVDSEKPEENDNFISQAHDLFS